VVDSNEPLPCRTWWIASLFAAKIAYDNESLTSRVASAAETMDGLMPGQRLEVNGWTFWITEEKL
jgi:hypothetical protein